MSKLYMRRKLDFIAISCILLYVLGCAENNQNKYKLDGDSLLAVNSDGRNRGAWTENAPGQLMPIKQSEYEKLKRILEKCPEEMIAINRRCRCGIRTYDSLNQGYITDLKIFELNFEQIQDLMADFKQLKHLLLENTQISSLKQLEKLKNLSSLTIYQYKLEGINDSMHLPKSFTKLKRLDLFTSNDLFLPTIVFPRENKLERMDLHNLKMLDDSFLYLKNLKQVSMKILDSVYNLHGEEEIRAFKEFYFNK